MWTISFTKWPLEMGAIQCTDAQETTHIAVQKNNWGTQSKAVFKICEGIWCSSFYVKEFDVIVRVWNFELNALVRRASGL